MSFRLETRYAPVGSYCLLTGGGSTAELHQLQQHAQTASERLLVVKLLEASNILEEQEAVSCTYQIQCCLLLVVAGVRCVHCVCWRTGVA
jgi:hypothetical protein